MAVASRRGVDPEAELVLGSSYRAHRDAGLRLAVRPHQGRALPAEPGGPRDGLPALAR
jgi:hypothetical protein